MRVIALIVAVFLCLPPDRIEAQALSQSQPVVVQSVAPTANPDGSVSTTTTRTDGSTVVNTTTPINNVTVTSYLPNASLPAALTVTNGGTLQLPVNPATGNAYGVYYLSGSGVILGATVKLPATISDGQFVRLVLPPGLSITTLTVQTSSSTTLTTVLTAIFGSPGLLYQMTNGTLARAG
jgi:hypothetical protein